MFVVVFAAGATAWWAAHRVGPDLSIITTAASLLGYDETGPSAHVVGYTSEKSAGAPAQAGTSATAGYCAAGAAPTYSGHFEGLKAAVGDEMGAPTECAHTTTTDGDTVQMTTTGLAAYDPSTDTASFTDGWRHWAMTPHGLVTWEGVDPNPPTG